MRKHISGLDVERKGQRVEEARAYLRFYAEPDATLRERANTCVDPLGSNLLPMAHDPANETSLAEKKKNSSLKASGSLGQGQGAEVLLGSKVRVARKRFTYKDPETSATKSYSERMLFLTHRGISLSLPCDTYAVHQGDIEGSGIIEGMSQPTVLRRNSPWDVRC